MQASTLRSAVVRGTVSRRGLSPHRRGFTLVEMLVAMALTLIMVYAIAEFYAYVGDIVRDGRAVIEMGGQLRSASQRLKRDLDSLTVRVVPWTDDGNNSGYFEYREGTDRDASILTLDADTSGTFDYIEKNATNLIGDADDIVAFTIRDHLNQFSSPNLCIKRTTNGNADFIPPGPFTSVDAEVIWWTGFSDSDADGVWDIEEPRFLYRRCLIIAPHLNEVDPAYPSEPAHLRNAMALTSDLTSPFEFHQHYDISARPGPVVNGQQTFIANSLADLARRENRFAHLRGVANRAQPIDLNPAFAGDPALTGTEAQNRRNSNNDRSLFRWVLGDSAGRVGEDVMLSNVLGFDVRVFDRNAPIVMDGTNAVAVSPGDRDFDASRTAVARGTYVDLNYAANSSISQFSGPPSFSTAGDIYDTWALSYERGAPGNGVAMDGLDNGTGQTGIVDDPGERVTSPPYEVALRGVQVKIRIYDPSSRQPRQATVVADFIDE